MKTLLSFFIVLAFAAPCLHAAGSYRVETVAGSGKNGDGGPALMAQIGAIQGVAVDPSGAVYLSDTDNHRVRKVDSKGIVTTIAGTGAPGFSGDGGPASAAHLNLPYGLALDSAGNLYVADLGNQRVRRIDPTGVITTYAGTGTKGFSGDSGPASAAKLSTPRNLALDPVGNLYIAEFDGHRIRRVTAAGTISTFAGTGTAGYSGDGALATSAQLNSPAGLAFDRNGALYVADSQNNRIRKILPGGLISTVASSGLAIPHAVAVDPASNLYVADGGTIVYAYSFSGIRSSFAGTAVRDFLGDGGPANKAALVNVLDLATDQAGNLFLADSVRIRKVDTAAKIQTVAGDGYYHAVGDTGAATDAILHQPSAVTLDFAGNLFIADPGTQRVRQVLPTGKIKTLDGVGSPVAALSANAPTNGLDNPQGVAVDSVGDLYIADTANHRIRVVSPTGIILTAVGTGTAGAGPDRQAPLQTLLQSPRAVCTDRNGVLYIVDTGNHRVLRLTAGGLIERIAGTGVSGLAGDSAQATLAQLNLPSACGLDSFGNLYIADTGNHRIRKVGASGIIATAAGTTAGFSGDEALATAAQLTSPAGIAVDDNGDIYIADTGNHRIRLVTPDGNIHTLAGLPAPGFSGDGADASAAQLNLPGGLFLDGSGDLYFADTGNDRVRRLVPTTTSASPGLIVAPPVNIANAASLQSGPVAPGEVVTISGAGLGPDGGIAGSLDSGQLPTQLGAAEVLFDQVPAPLLYVQSTQINVQVPYGVAGQTTTHVDVLYQGSVIGSLDLAVAAAIPGLYPVAVNEEGAPNSAKTPALAGSVLTLYATGEGLTDGPNDSGVPAQSPYPHPKLNVSASIGAKPATVIDAFGAPGVVGMLQVFVRIPGGTPSGQTLLQILVGGVPAPAISVWVK